MKNIIQTTLLALALLVPATSFSAPAIGIPPAVAMPSDRAATYDPIQSLAWALNDNRNDVIEEAIHSPGMNLNIALNLNIEAMPDIHTRHAIIRQTSYGVRGTAGVDFTISASTKLGATEENQTNSRFLMIAARRSSPEIITMLLDAGDEINHRSDTGKAAITHAIDDHRLDNVDLLLARGATTTTWEKLQILKLRALQHKGKIAAGAYALALAGLAYYIQAE